jgi:hypothetical protein
MAPYMDAAPLAPVLLVTAAWAAMYYSFLQLGPSARLSGKGEAQATMGARAFGNLHEQSDIFLVALWVHALFWSVADAATMGWAYLGFRALSVFVALPPSSFPPSLKHTHIGCADTRSYGPHAVDSR